MRDQKPEDFRLKSARTLSRVRRGVDSGALGRGIKAIVVFDILGAAVVSLTMLPALAVFVLQWAESRGSGGRPTGQPERAPRCDLAHENRDQTSLSPHRSPVKWDGIGKSPRAVCSRIPLALYPGYDRLSGIGRGFHYRGVARTPPIIALDWRAPAGASR